MRGCGEKQVEQERGDGAKEDGPTLGRNGRVATSADLATEVAVEREGEKRGVQHALGGGLVAARHVIDCNRTASGVVTG